MCRCHRSARVWCARCAALSARTFDRIGTSGRRLACSEVVSFSVTNSAHPPQPRNHRGESKPRRANAHVFSYRNLNSNRTYHFWLRRERQSPCRIRRHSSPYKGLSHSFTRRPQFRHPSCGAISVDVPPNNIAARSNGSVVGKKSGKKPKIGGQKKFRCRPLQFGPTHKRSVGLDQFLFGLNARMHMARAMISTTTMRHQRCGACYASIPRPPIGRDTAGRPTHSVFLYTT